MHADNNIQCKKLITAVYKKEGLKGVRRMMDPVIFRQIETQGIRQYSNTKTMPASLDDFLFILLALLIISFAMD